jgi:hypothetical protein
VRLAFDVGHLLLLLLLARPAAFVGRYTR